MPKFQRRHYVAMAAELANRNASNEEISDVIAKLRGTNPQFDATRFRSAAQGNPLKHVDSPSNSRFQRQVRNGLKTPTLA